MTATERRFQTSYREADTTEPGLVLEDDGTVWLVGPDGARTQLANGGSQPAHAIMLQPIQAFDGVDSPWGAVGDLRMGVVYDTDNFIQPGQTPDYVNRLEVPGGLDGLYTWEATMYVETDGGAITSATFILDDPSNSGDFVVDGPSGLGGELVGGTSITRPLLAGEHLKLTLARVNGAGSGTVTIRGGAWTTDPDNPDGPGIFDSDPTGSILTLTRIGPVPPGWAGY